MQPLLEARDLHFVRQLDAGPLKVLDGVDLTVQRGEVVDVFGPSGAGKTTLLRALALLQPGVTGELRLDGTRPAEMGERVWRTRVALLPQKPVILKGTVRENLAHPLGPQGEGWYDGSGSTTSSVPRLTGYSWRMSHSTARP